MNAITPTETAPRRHRKKQIRGKLRQALVYIAHDGNKQSEAASRAGLHPTNLCKALQKDHVKDELNRIKASIAEDIRSMEGHYRILALEHAWYLAKNANSEAVQARMVELLAGETKAGSTVNVSVSVDRGGYEYAAPGQRVVEIRGEATEVLEEGSGALELPRLEAPKPTE